MRKLKIGFAILLVIVIAAGAYYFYKQSQKSQQLLKDPTAAQQQEVKDVTSKVSKLMELPQGEDPSIVTVLDKEKLKDQVFFAKVENGDKVLIYTNAGQAILYRPSINKIINIAPINLGQPQATGIKMAVYNGTGTAGLITTFIGNIGKTTPNITIVDAANAAKSDYARSVVIDLTGKNTAIAKELAGLIGGDVSVLPAGETAPSADSGSDILVILGKNYAVPSPPAVPSPVATPQQ